MDWNQLISSLGNSIPLIIVLGYAWQREATRADTEASKRDADNKAWADRFAELAHLTSKPANQPDDIDISKRLN